MGKPKKETKRQKKTPEEKRKGRDKGWKEKVKVSKTAAKAAIKKREKTFRVSKPGVEAMQKVTTNYMKEVGHVTKELAKHRDSKTADQYDVHLATRVTPKSFYESDRELAKRPGRGKVKETKEKMKKEKVPKPKKEKKVKETKPKEPVRITLDDLKKVRNEKMKDHAFHYNGGFFKKVTDVDKKTTDGYSIKGDWLGYGGTARENPKFDEMLMPGDLILSKSLEGGRKRPEQKLYLFEVKDEGKVELIDDAKAYADLWKTIEKKKAKT